MDFEGALSALQGFLGKQVMVDVWAAQPDQLTFMAATLVGRLSSGKEFPASAPPPIEDGLGFEVGRVGDRTRASFVVSATLFVGSEWRDDPHPRTLWIYHRGGLATAISLWSDVLEAES